MSDRKSYDFSTQRYFVGFIEEVWRSVLLALLSSFLCFGVIYSSLLKSVFEIQDGISMQTSDRSFGCVFVAPRSGLFQPLAKENMIVIGARPLFHVSDVTGYAPCTGVVHWIDTQGGFVEQGRYLGYVQSFNTSFLYTPQSIPNDIRDHYRLVRISLKDGSYIRGYGSFRPDGYYVSFDKRDLVVSPDEYFRVVSEDVYDSWWSYFSSPLAGRLYHKT